MTTWVFGALNTIEPSIMMFDILEMGYQGPKDDDLNALCAWVGWIESRLDTLGRAGGKEYVLGRFTAADVLLTTVLRTLRDTNLVKKRPSLDAYRRRSEARPALLKRRSKTTWPSPSTPRAVDSGEVRAANVARRPTHPGRGDRAWAGSIASGLAIEAASAPWRRTRSPFALVRAAELAFVVGFRHEDFLALGFGADFGRRPGPRSPSRRRTSSEIQTGA